MWSWWPQKQQAVDSIKTVLTIPPGLTLYDQNSEACMSRFILI